MKPIWIGLVVIIIALGAGGLYWLVHWDGESRSSSPAATFNHVDNNASTATQTSNVTWQFSGDKWKALGSAPACANPLTIEPPVDLEKATAVLYPGQSRGGNYKPHGGLRFASGDISVTAPLAARVTRGSRYIEQGETQVLLEFVNSCGIMYRFDHLRTLSPAMQAVVDTFPAAKVDDSMTTNVATTVNVKAGDAIATAVGFTKTSNFSLDFGVYDLRQMNEAAMNASWAAAHDPELAHFGVCWLDLLPANRVSQVKSLPAGDSQMGKTSDYCK